MWDRLSAQTDVEFQQLDRLLATYRPLLERCQSEVPNAIELSALAAMLHSFYNGIENLLKRVAVETGEALPDGDVWHRKLLDQMSRPTDARPAVLTEELRSTLRLYLDFRHMFRHSYTFDLRWEKMREPALSCQATLDALRNAFSHFLRVAGEG